MKIEIELEEIERLKNRIAELEQRQKSTDSWAASLNESELIRKAKDFANGMLIKYFNAIFKSMGMEQTGDQCVKITDNWYSNNKDWYKKPEDLEITISAYVTEKFKEAFLNIGIVPKEETLERETL